MEIRQAHGNVIMELKIRKYGKNFAIVLPASLLKSLKLSVGKKVYVEVVNGKIVMTLFPQSRYSLSKLIAQCKPDNFA